MGKHNFVKYYCTTEVHSAQLMRLGDKGDDLGRNLGPGLSTKLVAKPMGSSCLAMESRVRWGALGSCESKVMWGALGSREVP